MGRHWLVTAWVDGLRQTLESAAGAEAAAAARIQVVLPEPAAWAEWPAPLWCGLDLGPAAAGLTAGAPHPTVKVIGQLLRGDPQLGDADCEAAFREFLSQAADPAARAISERLGRL
jgi:hypothetical protein